ncbi:MAG: hypothetical protein U9Q66_03270 [Patescibacteria group bacterium]|nr:hypothetical protein [Patescibacteria group bacterium]
MVNELIKINPKFMSYNQAVMDELVNDYLQILADDYQCEISELTKYIKLKDLHYMISIFKNEVELIWDENNIK